MPPKCLVFTAARQMGIFPTVQAWDVATTEGQRVPATRHEKWWLVPPHLGSKQAPRAGGLWERGKTEASTHCPTARQLAFKVMHRRAGGIVRLLPRMLLDGGRVLRRETGTSIPLCSSLQPALWSLAASKRIHWKGATGQREGKTETRREEGGKFEMNSQNGSSELWGLQSCSKSFQAQLLYRIYSPAVQPSVCSWKLEESPGQNCASVPLHNTTQHNPAALTNPFNKERGYNDFGS